MQDLWHTQNNIFLHSTQLALRIYKCYFSLHPRVCEMQTITPNSLHSKHPCSIPIMHHLLLKLCIIVHIMQPMCTQSQKKKIKNAFHSSLMFAAILSTYFVYFHLFLCYHQSFYLYFDLFIQKREPIVIVQSVVRRYLAQKKYKPIKSHEKQRLNILNEILVTERKYNFQLRTIMEVCSFLSCLLLEMFAF